MISNFISKQGKYEVSFESRQSKYISNSSKFLQAEIMTGFNSYLNINSNAKSKALEILPLSFFLIK